MTLFAGMYSLKSEKPIEKRLISTIKKSIARTPGKIDIYEDERFALIKWDCEAFRSPGIIDDEKGVTAITGEPYWEDTRIERYSRFYDLLKISEQLRKGNIGFLSECHGNYSVCHYEKESPQLILAVDKLGVRSLYYTIHGSILFFASALRILEGIEAIPRKFNIAAYAEKRVFGVALGNNTKYMNIHLLRDGEYLLCNRAKVKSAFYFHWGNIKARKLGLESLKTELYEVFRNAVSIRSSRDSSALSFLSGGLDSRCVVSVLNDLGKKVIAFNFFVPGDKDEIYGKQYAERLGIKYFPERRLAKEGVYQVISNKLDTIDQDVLEQSAFPRLVFSGDGGSVGMGHVYLSDALLEVYERDGRESAVDYFVSRRQLVDRIFRKKIRNKIRDIPRNGLLSELKEVSEALRGRDFFCFFCATIRGVILNNCGSLSISLESSF